MFVMLTANSWRKDEDSQKCFEYLMKYAGFPKEGPIMILYIDCEFKDISVDGMGTVTYPEKARKERWDFDLKDIPGIRAWEIAHDNLMGITDDIFYDKLWDKISKMQEEPENG